MRVRTGELQWARWWCIGLVVLALVVAIPVYWIALHAPAVGMFHDDGVYLVTAKSLATGHGYRILSLPGEIPQTKYPVLFPWVLSLVWRMAPDFPSNVFALKLVPFVFGLVWFWLVFRLVARESSREVAAVCVALSATTLWSVYLSTTLLSETLFAALCMGFLLVLRGEELSEENGPAWIAAGVLAGLACLTRTAGVCAVATGLLFYLRQRRLGKAAGFLAIALLVCGPWLVWTMTHHPPETDAYYSAANYGSWNVLSHFFSFDKKVTIVLTNALLLLRTPFTVAGIRWNLGAEVILALTGLAAAVRWLRPWTVIDTFLGIYLAMLLAWAWPPDRFVVVVYPLIVFLVWRVWQAAGISTHWLRVAGMTVVTILLGQGLWQVVSAAGLSRDLGTFPVMGPQDSWRETSAQLQWIRERTPVDAVVLANVDPVVYSFTERKAVRGFQADPYYLFYRTEAGSYPLGTVDDLRADIQKEHVTYLVRAPNQIFAEAPYLDRLILELAHTDPAAVRLVEQGADARFQIYHVDRPL